MKFFPYCGVLALTLSATLLVGTAPAQQPSPPVPSIEELKRQLEAKRQQAKQQLDAKQQLEAKQQLDAKQQQQAKQQLAKQQELKQQEAKQATQQQESAAPAPVAARTPVLPAADLVKAAQPAKNVLPVKLEANSTAAADSCPYPAAAISRGDTGTVVLLIYVADDGRAVDTKIESSSGSEVLDEAAASCVKEFGHFVPKRVGPRAEAAWFRMKFKWSFGE